MRIELPHFDPAAQLLAAGRYAKHGWKIAPEPVEPQSQVLKRGAEAELRNLLNAIEGRMTRFQIAEALGQSHNTVNKRLLILRARGQVVRNSKPPFLYWRP